MAFQFLAIAMALAAFLPALVYSYVKELVDELEQSHEELDKAKEDNKKIQKDASLTDDEKEKSENKLKKIEEKFNSLEDSIPRFVYVVDFIVTQSMALVIFSAFVGITIYLSSFSPEKYWLTSSICLFLELFVYALFSLGSYFLINTYQKTILIKYWSTGKIRGFECYRNIWIAFTANLVIILSRFSFDYFMLNSSALGVEDIRKLYLHQASFPLHVILGVLSLSLILYATSWLLPLISYKPLMGRVNLILTEINNKDKQEE